eukprot:5559177-Pyramimonas_sp.AAC.1
MQRVRIEVGMVCFASLGHLEGSRGHPGNRILISGRLGKKGPGGADHRARGRVLEGEGAEGGELRVKLDGDRI